MQGPHLPSLSTVGENFSLASQSKDLEMKAVQPRVLSTAPISGKVEPTFPRDFNLAV